MKQTDVQQIHRVERNIYPSWEYESLKLEQNKEAAYAVDISIDIVKRYSVQLYFNN